MKLTDDLRDMLVNCRILIQILKNQCVVTIGIKLSINKKLKFFIRDFIITVLYYKIKFKS